MQSTEWAAEHSACLRELLAGGLSYARIAAAINTKFNTSYTRNAAIGRAKRMGLSGPSRPAASLWPSHGGQRSSFQNGARFHATARLRDGHRIPGNGHRIWPMVPEFESTPVALRCVGIEPRHLSLLELEDNDCRYPYGGDRDGEAITFCGHPKRDGSSYCTPHFHLTLGPGASLPERGPAPRDAAGKAVLRLVEAA